MSFKTRIILSLLAAIFFTYITGCGRKAPPVPPGTLRPQAIDDLSFRITPEGAVISWTIPEKNMDGSPILTIDGFILYRAEALIEDFCKGCPPNFTSPLKIPFNIDPDNAGMMSYEDRTLQTGIIYTYEVRTSKGVFNISDPSNRIFLAWHPVPTAPLMLKAEPAPDGVNISWQAPKFWSDGSPLRDTLLYTIKRKKKSENNWKILKNGYHGTSFYDVDTDHKTLYLYRVEAVYNYAETPIISPESRISEAASRLDTNAPYAPEKIRIMKSPEGVLIRWDANVEPDIAGYNIYRKGRSGIRLLLNRTPIPLNRFIDRTRLMPGKYTYSVTAVDNSVVPNESAESESQEILIK